MPAKKDAWRALNQYYSTCILNVFYSDLMTEIQSIDDEENDSFVLLILWYIKCSSAGEEDGFSPL